MSVLVCVCVCVLHVCLHRGPARVSDLGPNGHHPNGTKRASTHTAMYYTYTCMFELLKSHTQHATPTTHHPPPTRTRSALAIRLEGEMFMIYFD